MNSYISAVVHVLLDTCTCAMSNQTRADGSVLSHLQIAENVWDPVKKRSRVRIHHNCGRSDDPNAAERLRRLARSILKRCSPEELVAAPLFVTFPRWNPTVFDRTIPSTGCLGVRQANWCQCSR